MISVSAAPRPGAIRGGPLSALRPADSGLPTRVQELLFQAIYVDEARFAPAFAGWAAVSAPDTIDRASRALLAMLAPRLAAIPQESPWASVIREQYRQNRLRNALTFHALEETLAGLTAAGIDALVLKGAALIERYYGDRGLRHMADFDLLVREDDFRRAAEHMRSNGWRPQIAPEHFDERFAHALTFEHPRGTSADLHCHALLANTSRDSDRAFWDAAVALRIGTVPTRTLSAAHHMVHLAAHGMAWMPEPAIRWVADILTLASKTRVDWNEVADRALGHGVGVHVGSALAYLKRTFDLPVPAPVLQRLTGAPRPAADMRSNEPLGRRLRFHWYALARSRPGATLGERAWLLPAYLRYLARADRRTVLPWLLSRLPAFLRRVLPRAQALRRSTRRAR